MCVENLHKDRGDERKGNPRYGWNGLLKYFKYLKHINSHMVTKEDNSILYNYQVFCEIESNYQR